MPRRFLFLRRSGLLFTLFIGMLSAQAQDSLFRYQASLNVAGSTGPGPFWQHANQQGAVPSSGRFVMGKWGIAKDYADNAKLMQWRAGAELVTSYAKKENIFFTDLFAAVKLGPVELLAGQKNSRAGLADTTLSSGSLAVSENARPFPRVQLAIPEFLPLSFTGNVVALKASYSDGLLENSSLLYGDAKHRPATYFHQKTFYLRIGSPDHRLSFYTGFNHQVMWGGENRIWPADSLNYLKAYFHTITGKAKGFKKIGDHFGTIDFGAQWKGVNWSYFIYRQSVYATGSLYRIINPEDGLNGIRIKRSEPLPANATYFALDAAVLEFVYTRNQINSHPPFGLSIYEQANYFNSFLYQNGWSYRGYGIGTPLAPDKESTDKKLPENTTQFTNNNRILAIHTGVSATWLGAKFIFKGTYSLNYGSFLTPFDVHKEQLSVLLSAEKKAPFGKGFDLIASVSSDYGKLYPNSTGIALGLRKKGFIK